MSDSFLQRYNRDQCEYALTYQVSNKHITGIIVTAKNNQCSAAIPVTSPVELGRHSFATEQLGNDPLTVWVQLKGDPVTIALASPIPL